MYQKLREMRIKNKYTTQAMAEQLGISKSFYSQIETGSRKLSYNMAVFVLLQFLKEDQIIFSMKNSLEQKKMKHLSHKK